MFAGKRLVWCVATVRHTAYNVIACRPVDGIGVPSAISDVREETSLVTSRLTFHVVEHCCHHGTIEIYIWFKGHATVGTVHQIVVVNVFYCRIVPCTFYNVNKRHAGWLFRLRRFSIFSLEGNLYCACSCDSDTKLVPGAFRYSNGSLRHGEGVFIISLLGNSHFITVFIGNNNLINHIALIRLYSDGYPFAVFSFFRRYSHSAVVGCSHINLIFRLLDCIF